VSDALTALWKDAGAARVELDALGSAAVAELAAALLGAPLERRAGDWLARRSAGNPLYLKELIATALAEGSLVQERGRWRQQGSLGVGSRLTELIEGRIGELSAPQRHTLALLALAEPMRLAELEQLTDPAVIGTLESRGVVAGERDQEQVMLRTAHPLYGEVLRARLGTVALRDLHLRLAGVLDRSLPGRRMLLALWQLADGDEPDPQLLSAAAADALAAFDPRLAERFARAALAADSTVPGALLLGRALRGSGAFVEAEALLARYEAEVSLTPDAPEYLFTRAAGLHFGLGRSGDALALLERAVEWSEDPGWRGEVECLAATVLFTSGRLAEGVERASVLLEDADLGPRARLTVGWLLGVALPWLGRPCEGIAALRRARELAGAEFDPEWPETVALTNGEICAGEGWPEAVARLAAAHAQAVAGGNEQLAMDIEIGMMDLAAVQGDVVACRRWAEEALTRLADTDPSGLAPFCLAEVARSAALSGDIIAARGALETARGYAARRPLLPASVFRLGLAEATVTAAEGRLEHARQLALDVARGAVEAGEVLLQEAAALHLYLRLGGAAGTVAGRLTEIAQATSGVTLAHHWAAQARATQRHDGAALEEIARVYEGIDARLWAAEAYAQAGAAHADAGRPSAAARARGRAAELARACGVAGTPLLVLDRLAGLSPREREVAGLVSRGFTNAEISAALVLSVRTVESHVYHATTKLGLRSRTELGTWMQARAGPADAAEVDPIPGRLP
jgi:DNA-binding CsgD family transcriptional regulator/tetratricopeptide (TPR) repeat protein